MEESGESRFTTAADTHDDEDGRGGRGRGRGGGGGRGRVHVKVLCVCKWKKMKYGGGFSWICAFFRYNFPKMWDPVIF